VEARLALEPLPGEAQVEGGRPGDLPHRPVADRIDLLNRIKSMLHIYIRYQRKIETMHQL
jgi:hypothetical protein